jgi:hypothetical protein
MGIVRAKQGIDRKFRKAIKKGRLSDLFILSESLLKREAKEIKQI